MYNENINLNPALFHILKKVNKKSLMKDKIIQSRRKVQSIFMILEKTVAYKQLLTMQGHCNVTKHHCDEISGRKTFRNKNLFGLSVSDDSVYHSREVHGIRRGCQRPCTSHWTRKQRVQAQNQGLCISFKDMSPGIYFSNEAPHFLKVPRLSKAVPLDREHTFKTSACGIKPH